MKLRRLVLGAALAAALAAVPAVHAGPTITLGPGTGIGENQQDSGGSRLNIDLTKPATLAPGTYAATTFTYDAANLGPNALNFLQPFLAVVTSGTPGSGSETYKVIEAGVPLPAVAGIQTVPFFGSPFTVPAGGETVFAGFTTLGDQPVLFFQPPNQGLFGTNDAHRNPGGLVVEGDTFTETGGQGNGGAYELSRKYAFSVSIAATPEPGSLTLLGVGAVGLLGYRLRRRKPAAA